MITEERRPVPTPPHESIFWLRRAERPADDEDDDGGESEMLRDTVAAERQRLIELRDNGTIGDAAFQRVEQELDMRELNMTETSES